MTASAFDVVVVGLGHAGCEAALACARTGLRTLGVTLRRDRIAVMSCNPAIGGTAKGHLVKEIDALGGEMARAADLTGTHFKILNMSKGPAVRATRVLCDRDAYAARMSDSLFNEPRLTIFEGEVRDLLVKPGFVHGVVLADGSEIQAKAVILTTGTFLQALMHVGEKKEIGGRLGDEAARGLSNNLKRIGFELGRFKTGTPARLHRSSINYTRCETQPGDHPPRATSRSTRSPFPAMPQVECHITYTTKQTHEIIRQNLNRSPLYQGEIVGRGPRYCPSLEDKVVRFSSRERHQVFLEPEGPSSDVVYPAGLSTSLPADVQERFLRSIPGLESVEILRYGYAVEYDFAPPTQLRHTLETKAVKGLYFAGQLNGTSGYEEAAFQGLIAGLNASLRIRGEPPLVLQRHEAHGAVMIDDLVTRGVDEPFRMFTSRSEHRLRLREGNADLRLRAHGHRAGLVTAEEMAETERRRETINAEISRLRKTPLAALLRRPEETYQSIGRRDPARPALSPDITEEVETELKYEGYIAQHDRLSIRQADAWDGCRIPDQFRFESIPGLSTESVERLSRSRPETIGQAKKLPGLTPAAISLLLIHLRRLGKAQSDWGE